MEVKRRPKEDVGKADMKKFTAMYLHPCPITPRGHVVAPLEKLDKEENLEEAKWQVRTAVVAVAMSPIQREGQTIYPNVRFPPSRYGHRFLRLKGTPIGPKDDGVAEKKFDLTEDLYTPPRRSPRLLELAERQKAEVKANLSDLRKGIETGRSVGPNDWNVRYNLDGRQSCTKTRPEPWHWCQD